MKKLISRSAQEVSKEKNKERHKTVKNSQQLITGGKIVLFAPPNGKPLETNVDKTYTCMHNILHTQNYGRGSKQKFSLLFGDFLFNIRFCFIINFKY